MDLLQSTMWQAIEERLAVTANPRHRAMLQVVIEHARAEAERSVDRLMATLVDDPHYHFWVGGRDVGPKGRDGSSPTTSSSWAVVGRCSNLRRIASWSTTTTWSPKQRSATSSRDR